MFQVYCGCTGTFLYIWSGVSETFELADVAEMVGIHESTVSRAVKDKYLQCSWGIFPMNYFFIGAISKAGNENAATADTARIF